MKKLLRLFIILILTACTPAIHPDLTAIPTSAPSHIMGFMTPTPINSPSLDDGRITHRQDEI